MKTEKNILIAFILNVSFSIFEIIGGIITNSVAILSDAIHDFGDSISIGISYFLEKISKKKPDEQYTYGYTRYSILGAFITTTILIVSSALVIYGGITRIINPVNINYNGMILFGIFGVIINFLAAYFTKEGESINQKAVNLHMLEDVLGWLVVLLGAILMKFTDISIIDPIMSIGVAIYIFIHAFKNFKQILDLFLEKVPNNISIKEIREHITNIKDVLNIHHLHLWSMDGVNNYATMHIVTNAKNISKLKKEIKQELSEHGINHATIEIEPETDNCDELECKVKKTTKVHSHHHH
ncbi:MAG: cation transporter [Bacilli bacterium]|nr:cation transporter [Bacilli bacterium]